MTEPSESLKWDSLLPIAQTGTVPGNWPQVLSLIKAQIPLAFENYKLKEPYNEHIISDPLTGTEASLASMIEECQTRLDMFKESPPFTIQRLVELLSDPLKQYSEHKADSLIKALLSIIPVSANDYPSVDFDTEVEKDQQGQHGGKDAAAGVLLSPIEWMTPDSPNMGTAEFDVVDTGKIDSIA